MDGRRQNNAEAIVEASETPWFLAEIGSRVLASALRFHLRFCLICAKFTVATWFIQSKMEFADNGCNASRPFCVTSQTPSHTLRKPLSNFDRCAH